MYQSCPVTLLSVCNWSYCQSDLIKDQHEEERSRDAQHRGAHDSHTKARTPDLGKRPRPLHWSLWCHWGCSQIGYSYSLMWVRWEGVKLSATVHHSALMWRRAAQKGTSRRATASASKKLSCVCEPFSPGSKTGHEHSKLRLCDTWIWTYFHPC